jgi:hypothetical protein
MSSPLPPEHTRPRLARVTPRKRTEAYKHEWEETLKRRNEWKKGRFNRISTRKPRGVRGPEFVLALERASQATSDPIFVDALRAARQYGLDREFERSAARLQVEMFGNPLDGHLAQVAFLVARGKLEKRRGWRWRRRLSIREACKCVVAETGLPGHSFEAAVERLRKLAHPRSDNSPILDLEAAMTSLWARRIVEQEFLIKGMLKKRPPA